MRRLLLVALLLTLACWLLRQPSTDARVVSDRVNTDPGKRYTVNEMETLFDER